VQTASSRDVAARVEDDADDDVVDDGGTRGSGYSCAAVPSFMSSFTLDSDSSSVGELVVLEEVVEGMYAGRVHVWEPMCVHWFVPEKVHSSVWMAKRQRQSLMNGEASAAVCIWMARRQRQSLYGWRGVGGSVAEMVMSSR
jgi:hypothetical protein